jgi:hypothetical protein
VKETYTWIEDNSKICLMDEFDEKRVSDFLNKKGNYKLSHTKLFEKYELLISVLND